MSSRHLWLFVVAGLVTASSSLAGQSPVAVSPGDASKLALVEGRCPTFSWDAVDGARSYELVSCAESSLTRSPHCGAMYLWSKELVSS